MVGHNPRRRRVLRVKTLGRSAPESVTLKRPHSSHAHVCGLVQARVTTDLVCAMVCASEGNVSKRLGRPWEFDLRLVCALVCARHIGRSANQIKAHYPHIVTGLEATFLPAFAFPCDHALQWLAVRLPELPCPPEDA